MSNGAIEPANLHMSQPRTTRAVVAAVDGKAGLAMNVLASDTTRAQQGAAPIKTTLRSLVDCGSRQGRLSSISCAAIIISQRSRNALTFEPGFELSKGRGARGTHVMLYQAYQAHSTSCPVRHGLEWRSMRRPHGRHLQNNVIKNSHRRYELISRRGLTHTRRFLKTRRLPKA